MEQVFFNVPLSKLEPIFKKWIKEAQEEFQITETSLQTTAEKILTAEEAAQFLGLMVSTIYRKVSRGELPVIKHGKRIYFSNVELIDFLKRGRKKSNAEIEAVAQKHLSTIEKKGQKVEDFELAQQ